MGIVHRFERYHSKKEVNMSALKINRNSLRWVGLAALVMVCVALLGRPAGLVAAQPVHMPTFKSPADTVATIGFASGTLEIPINGTGISDVQVSNVENLAGVEFHIAFDPAQLQVVSTAAGAFFSQNGIPMPLIPTHDNTAGKVDFVGSVVAPAVPYSGAAPIGVGSITWKVVSCPPSGQIPLTLINTKLSDPNGAAITYTRSDSTIICPQPVTPPTAPSNLTASAMSASQIDLAWTDNANDEDGFKIERCTGTGCTDFAQIATVASNVTTYSDTGLTAETTYCYRVRAFNANGDSDYSNIASATTPAPLPTAPSNLTASAMSVSQIDLAWADNANNEDGFKIERCTGTGCTDFAQITTVASNITSHSDTGLTAVTTYCYRVRAFNAAGDSDYSNTACATTPQALPAAPSNLTASAVSVSQIDLAWADNADNEDGFKIERCTGTGCTDFAQITTVASNVTSHSDTGLTAETTYCYRVRAFNAGGDSDYSNTACATTRMGKDEGVVLLQGRTDHSGTAVYLTEDACPAVQALSVKGLPNVVSAVTDATGKFELEPLPDRTYQCLLATHDMYLVARRSSMTVALPSVTLLGGNVVADKTINIFDLARIANSIGSTDPTVDINGDGKVDVYDLTIAAGNFGKEEPLPW
jgi:fibronectin type 3 domain-containing protein